MVSTRGHPSAFPQVPSSNTPDSRTTRSGTKANGTIVASQATSNGTYKSDPTSSPSDALSPRCSPRLQSQPSTAALPKSKPRPSTSAWSHTPSNLTLLWLAISLPLVVWDTGYVLLRPYSMPGGSLHSPIWTPYALYGEVDYTYGFPAWERHDGFAAAQGTLNAVETIGYAVYLWILWTWGRQEGAKGKGAPGRERVGRLGEARVVQGSVAAWAVLLGFGTSLMTVSKTVLYWLNEYFSGFENIGHNGTFRLVFMWIIPNGAWLVLPSYMIYVFGREILEGLESATGESRELRKAR